VKVLLALVVLTSLGCNLRDRLAKDDAGATTSTAQPLDSASASASIDSGAASAAPGKTATPAGAPAATTAKKAGVPTCKATEVMVSVALSPLKPFCTIKCKTDADCKVGGCVDVNLLDADAKPPKGGQQFIKACDPEVTKPTPTASASAGPPKCKSGEHYDDINKKCRPEGDCPKGYAWNDPMKTCIMQ